MRSLADSQAKAELPLINQILVDIDTGGSVMTQGDLLALGLFLPNGDIDGARAAWFGSNATNENSISTQYKVGGRDDGAAADDGIYTRDITINILAQAPVGIVSDDQFEASMGVEIDRGFGQEPHSVSVTWKKEDRRWEVRCTTFELDEEMAGCPPTKKETSTIFDGGFNTTITFKDVVRKDEEFSIGSNQDANINADLNHNGFDSFFEMKITSACSFSDQFDNDFILGDVNRDGAVNFSDIPAFIAALQSGEYDPAADINEDCVLDFADIPAFIALLSSL